MYKYACLNPIAAVGLNNLTDAYERTEDFATADAFAPMIKPSWYPGAFPGK